MNLTCSASSPASAGARAIAAGLVAFAFATALSGCATVSPWERGRLAHDCMQFPVDRWESAWEGHVQSVREGAAGGALAGGGGCGCN